MTNCRYCEALDCDPEVHEAAANIHAYLRSLVNRNWAKDMAKAKAEAKKLWKVRHEKPNYRVAIQNRVPMNPQEATRKGGKASGRSRQYRKTHPEAK